MVDNTDDRTDDGTRTTTRRGFMRGTGALATAALLGAGGTASAEHGGEPDLAALVDQMELEEKVQRTRGGSGGPSGIAGYLPGIPRLDVPEMGMADGPPGASLGSPTTDFPHPISAAATFDPDFATRQGRAIAREAKSGDVTILLAPSMDMFRIPLHARAGETYGEDPYLASELAREYTVGVQSEGVVATLKHFAAYNQTSTTGSVNDYFSPSEHDVIADERTLREIYLPPFREAITEGDAGAVMPAYNRVNGIFCSEHDDLLDDILRDDWEFDGMVISDWGGTHSTVHASVNGLDVEMPSGNYFGSTLADAVENDRIDEETVVDEMVRHGLQAQHDVGALSGDRLGSEPARGTDEHFSLAQEMAAEGSVLLQNDTDALPLGDETSEIAIVGPDPTSFKQSVGGSDSITAIRRVALHQGIEEISGDTTVNTVATRRPETVGPDEVRPTDDVGSGFTAEYFDNADWSGKPVRTRTEETVELTQSDLDSLDSDTVSVRWSGTLVPSESGTVALELTSQGSGRVVVDGEPVIRSEGGGFIGPKTEEATLELQSGTEYEIVVEAAGSPPVTLEWTTPSVIDDAAAAAADADATIVLAQTDTFYGDDRHEFGLPGNQNAVIDAVAAESDNSVVLLNTEAPVAMPWVEDVDAIMAVWFPGQEGGTAVANLLFGERTPSGKSPVTFAESLSDYLPGEVESLPDDGRAYPGVSGTVHYDEGVFVGYRHFDEADIDPLFPFGHGESYTSFEYSSVRVTPSSVEGGDSVTVRVDIQNAGDRNGQEAVQVYAAPQDPTVERPPKELAGVQKLSIAAGETETAEITVDADAFRYWDPDTEQWTLDTGQYDLLVGASSRDIRGETTIQVRDVNGQ
ncbi:glycoside hydrolase family 3 protein [Haloarcula montana]|uniref:glycoside hydrolase family 3 protein n=1 Tax=Haloarcula montana TaxID=3111776 RepID=UPI002D76FCDA|nr:glycoside hydrolase family 3 C-terminal domain-containing protein [Haloarcula sp. GH36]